jgi:hypothetical protein
LYAEVKEREEEKEYKCVISLQLAQAPRNFMREMRRL